MFGKNWKTSLAGLSMILTAVGDIVHGLSGDMGMIHWEADLVAMGGGLGLLFAKDGNVTGGTVVQATAPEALAEKFIEETKHSDTVAAIVDRRL